MIFCNLFSILIHLYCLHGMSVKIKTLFCIKVFLLTNQKKNVLISSWWEKIPTQRDQKQLHINVTRREEEEKRFFFFFFSICVFFHEHSRFTGQQGKGEAISLNPLYNFHWLHRHLDISRAITGESSPLLGAHLCT